MKLKLNEIERVYREVQRCRRETMEEYLRGLLNTIVEEEGGVGPVIKLLQNDDEFGIGNCRKDVNSVRYRSIRRSRWMRGTLIGTILDLLIFLEGNEYTERLSRRNRFRRILRFVTKM